jgi:cAMP-binding proteins - catabolite gene activator and regulatory subunit of cAMP-dependent protein kinases
MELSNMDFDIGEKHKYLNLSCPILNTSTLALLGAKLEADDLHLLKSLANAKKFVKNSSLGYTNERIENLLFLHTGVARMAHTGKDGMVKIFSYIAAGCFLGEAAFFHKQPVLYDIQFVENSEVLFIDRSHLPHILERPRLMLFLTTAISLASRILAMQIEDASFRSTEGKICRALACLSGNEKTQYKLTFTHQELADLTGVHRVNVTNTLNMLKKAGIISCAARGNIMIIDREKLLQRIYKEE